MNKKNHTIDATNKILGRLAAEAAVLLMGKNKTNFTSYRDEGDDVTVINVDKLRVTGKKNEQKKYYHYSGYPGGLREKSYEELFKMDPREVLRKAVFGMLPKNKLRSKMIKRLKLHTKGAANK